MPPHTGSYTADSASRSMALSTTPRRPSASRVAPDQIPLRERAQIPRRRLFDPDGDSTKTPGAAGAWLGDEVKALVEFLLFHKKGDTWPCHKRDGQAQLPLCKFVLKLLISGLVSNFMGF